MDAASAALVACHVVDMREQFYSSFALGNDTCTREQQGFGRHAQLARCEEPAPEEDHGQTKRKSECDHTPTSAVCVVSSRCLIEIIGQRVWWARDCVR